MKTIVNVLIVFFGTLTLNGQSYAADELIIRFEASTTDADRQEVRTLYGIIDAVPLGQDLELWKGITFPLPVTEGGSTTILDNIEELLEYIIEIQTSDQGTNTNTTANINEGNFNLNVFLDNLGALYEGDTFDPLPFCDEIHNNRLIGPDQSGNPAQSRIKIIIVDQVIDNVPGVEMNSGPDLLGGTHGRKVYSIINNILTQAGLTQVEYLSLPVFDAEGRGSSAALIEVAEYIADRVSLGEWTDSDRILVNFSANVIYSQELIPNQGSSILDKEWSKIFSGGVVSTGELIDFQNVLLVSAVGNQNINTNNVFPGAKGYRREVSVAGTQNCFLEPWTQTNHHAEHYEIAAEADNVLTFDGTNYQLSTGTSFAVPQFTAALAQVVAYNLFTETNNLTEIKDMFLENMPTNPALSNTVKDGKVLDISSIFAGNPGGGQNPGGNFLQSANSTLALTLQTTPNPFSQNAIVNIGVAVGQSPHLSLYNSIGQLVHQEVIPNQQELTELQWYTPDQLARGTYLLRVQVGDTVEQQMIVKQ